MGSAALATKQPRPSRLGLVVIGVVALLFLAGCSSGGSEPTTEPTLVVDNDTITIPDLSVRVTFDETVSGTEQDPDVTVHRTSFYDGDLLVFTAYDTDGDGQDDLWFEYDEDRRLTIEFRDTDGDGQPDRALRFDQDENVIDEISLPLE
jgi:hypothetical protein